MTPTSTDGARLGRSLRSQISQAGVPSASTTRYPLGSRAPITEAEAPGPLKAEVASTFPWACAVVAVAQAMARPTITTAVLMAQRLLVLAIGAATIGGSLAREAPHEGAALVVRRPGHAEAGAAVAVDHGHGR